MLFASNTATQKHFTGMYLENETMYKTDVDVSQGTATMAYYLSSVEWNDCGLESDYKTVVDLEKGTITMSGVCKPVNSETGGIALLLYYEITLFLKNDGTVYATGTLDVVGGGTEQITYYIVAAGVEFVKISTFEGFEYFHAEAFEYEIETVTETEGEYIPFTQVISHTEVIPGEVITVTDLQQYITSTTSSHLNTTQEPTLTEPEPDGFEQPDLQEPDTDSGTTDQTTDTTDSDTPVPDDGLQDSDTGTDTDTTQNPGEDTTTETDTETDRLSRIVVMSNSAISGLKASSELKDNSGTYYVKQAFDGNLSTAWVEGVSGAGIGESIDVTFSRTVALAGIYFSNGYLKSQKLFEANGRALEIELVFDDGSNMILPLYDGDFDVNSDGAYTDYFVFEQTVETKSVQIIITDAVTGTKYDDICITEISFLEEEGR